MRLYKQWQEVENREKVDSRTIERARVAYIHLLAV
jgi:hypothetical protein